MGQHSLADIASHQNRTKQPDDVEARRRLSFDVQQQRAQIDKVRRDNEASIPDMVGETVQNAAYQGSAAWIKGATQLFVDDVANNTGLYKGDKATNLLSKYVFDPIGLSKHEDATYGSRLWYSQVIGTGAGYTVPWLITHNLRSASGLSGIARAESSIAQTGKLMSATNLIRVTDTAATGFISDFVFRPVEGKEAEGSVAERLLARTKHGAQGATTLGLGMTATSLGLRHASRGLVAMLEGPGIGNATARALYNTGIVAATGPVSGELSANTGAWMDGRLATPEERAQARWSMTVGSGVLHLTHEIKAFGVNINRGVVPRDQKSLDIAVERRRQNIVPRADPQGLLSNKTQARENCSVEPPKTAIDTRDTMLRPGSRTDKPLSKGNENNAIQQPRDTTSGEQTDTQKNLGNKRERVADDLRRPGDAPGVHRDNATSSGGRGTGITSNISEHEIPSRRFFLDQPRTNFFGLLNADGQHVLSTPDGRVQAVGTYRQRLTWHFFDEKVEQDYHALRKLRPRGDLFIARSLPSRWIVQHVRDDRPAEFLLFNRENKEASPLFLDNRDENQNENQGAKMRNVSFRARDGERVFGYLLDTPDMKGVKPMILNVHGGPVYRDYWGWSRFLNFLASRGYSVFTINYRGSAGYGPKYEQAGWRPGWAGKMQTDLIDGLDWVRKRGIADDRVAILGESYGGYAALHALTFTPTLFCCGISIAGPADLVRHDVNFRRRDLLAELSPITHVDKLERSVFLAHGARDTRVHPEQSSLFAEAARRHGKEVEHLVFPDEDHFIWSNESKRRLWAAIESFLHTHLGGLVEPSLPEESWEHLRQSGSTPAVLGALANQTGAAFWQRRKTLV